MTFKYNSTYRDPDDPSKERVVFGSSPNFVVVKKHKDLVTLKVWHGDLDKTASFWTTKKVDDPAPDVISDFAKQGNAMLRNVGATDDQLIAADTAPAAPTPDRKPDAKDEPAKSVLDPAIAESARERISRTAIGSAGKPTPSPDDSHAEAREAWGKATTAALANPFRL